MKINPDFNFTIVLPGGCNAKCDFCFWEKITPNHDYIFKLEETLDKMLGLRQMSISGGEPTLSDELKPLLQSLRKYNIPKVVLTTNGVMLSKFYNDMKGVVKHVNISRHRANDEDNYKVFGTKTVPNVAQISDIVRNLEQIGIDTNINMVYQDGMHVDEFFKMVDLCKNIGVRSLTIRNDFEINNIVELNAFEDSIKDYVVTFENSCPICVTRHRLFKGLEIRFKYSDSEPSDNESYDFDVYELIYQQNGILYIDWSSKKPVEILPVADDKPKNIERNTERTVYNNYGCIGRGGHTNYGCASYSSYGCGRGSCG